MFGKLFGKKKAAESSASCSEPISVEQEKANLLHAAVERQHQIDPLAPLKIGANELVQRLLDASKDDRGFMCNPYWQS